jgi:DNA-binding protein HU-beta
MNKSELIDTIAAEAGLTKTDAAKSLDVFINAVTKSLKNGTKVTIPGFVTFEKIARPARTGRNPSTGKEIKIAAKNAVKIKAGKTLQDAIN